MLRMKIAFTKIFCFFLNFSGESTSFGDTFSSDDTSARSEMSVQHTGQNAGDGGGVRQNGENHPNVETVYRKAAEFIALTERLQRAPERLKSLLERLQQSSVEFQCSIESLQRQADELKTLNAAYKS